MVGAGILVAAFLLASFPSRAADPLTPEQAAQHIGDEAQVCGTVASATHATNLRGTPTFLNLGKPFPHQVFTAVIHEADRGAFSYPPESLQGAKICVSGTISQFNGATRIVVTSPSQIKRTQ